MSEKHGNAAEPPLPKREATRSPHREYAAQLLLPGDRTPYGTVVECKGRGPYVKLTTNTQTRLLPRHELVTVVR